MSDSKTKLILKRETLVPLTPDELDDVHGGTGTLIKTAIEATKRVCVPATKWLTKNVCVPVSLELCRTILPHGDGGNGQNGNGQGQ